MLNETKTIDKNIPVPLYYQLKELILEAINENKYTAGDVIPTEKEISSYYQISRTTVRQAIGELVQEGILYRVKSKGTFVAEPKIKQEYISKIQSFNDEILHRGMTPSTEVLQFRVLEGEEILFRESHAGIYIRLQCGLFQHFHVINVISFEHGSSHIVSFS